MIEPCTAKIRPFIPINDKELQCEVLGPHPEHRSVLRDYAYPGSATVIYWQEHDRRTFRGDWQPCSSPDCMLPLGHRGRHA